MKESEDQPTPVDDQQLNNDSTDQQNNGSVPASENEAVKVEEEKTETEQQEEDLSSMNERAKQLTDEEIAEQEKARLEAMNSIPPPEDWLDECEITVRKPVEESDTHRLHFEFFVVAKNGKTKTVHAVCLAPDNEKAAWNKTVRYLSELYPTVVFNYRQKFNKAKIGE